MELYNGGPEVVDLTGYHLTDNVYRPDKWVFPEVALAPSAFLLVWCTGKSAAPAPHGVEVIDDGRLTVPPALHANFKLKRGGETVLLTLAQWRHRRCGDSANAESGSLLWPVSCME